MTPQKEDAILAGVLRRFLTADEPYTDVRDYQIAGVELILDGRIGLTSAEAALVKQVRS